MREDKDVGVRYGNNGMGNYSKKYGIKNINDRPYPRNGWPIIGQGRSNGHMGGAFDQLIPRNRGPIARPLDRPFHW